MKPTLDVLVSLMPQQAMVTVMAQEGETVIIVPMTVEVAELFGVQLIRAIEIAKAERKKG